MAINSVLGTAPIAVTTVDDDATVSAQIATQAESEAGSVSNKLMTPLRTADAIKGFPFVLPGYGTHTAGRTIVDRAKDAVNVREFRQSGLPAVGTGDTASDTAALRAAIAYCSSTSTVQRPSLQLGAISLLVDNIELNSVRGLRILGEGTLDAVYHRTEIKLSPDHTKNTALLRLTSCANIDIEGVYFGINGQTGLQALISTDCNAAAAEAPLNRFANNFHYWRYCVFDVPSTLVTGRPSIATFDLVSASNVEFDRCYFQGQVGLKIGAHEEIVGGDHTVPDGRASVIYVHDSYMRGDIALERCYGANISRNQFFSRTDSVRTIPKIYAAGNYPTQINAQVTREISIIQNVCDPNAAVEGGGLVFSGGTWFKSGTNPESDDFYIEGNLVAGTDTCFQIERGNAVIEVNRPVPLTSASPQRVVSRGASANVRLINNRDEDWLTINKKTEDENGDEVEFVNARLLHEMDPASLPKPLITNMVRTSDYTIGAINIWVPLVTTYQKFAGQRVRFRYDLNLRHLDTVARNYQVRWVVGERTLDGATIPGTRVTGTERRATYDVEGGYFNISAEVETYVEPTAQPVKIELQVIQTAGTAGVVLGNTVAGSTASVTLLDY